MAEGGNTGATGTAVSSRVNGGRFDFDDGGTFLGGWEDGKAHGHGVCTGPKGQGAYSGSWHYGFEVSGVYIWPSGSAYEGQWQNGKRHGLGVESRGRWMYRGEWSQGFKGRYGVRQSSTSNARYEGTWANGLQDGYGSETYADGGTYQGQWLRGMRHGYGVRNSAPFGQASHYRPNKNLRASLTSLRSADGGASATGVGGTGGTGGGAGGNPEAAAAERDRRVDDSRGGFVLKAKSDEAPVRRRSLVEKSSNIKKTILSGLKIRKQRSTGDLEKRGTSGGSIRSTGSSASWVSTESSQSGVTGSLHTDSNASFVVEDEHMDASVTESYLGEWKNDKRSGFGISERSDGLKYEGEWFNNKKYGYGVTTFRDGSKEEGKYKNNVLITSQKKKHLFLIRSAKFRERIDAAVSAAQRASKIALQKADIAISRTATARGKAETADLAAEQARVDFEIAQATAKQFAPDFVQPGLEKLRNREIPRYRPNVDVTRQVPPTVNVNSTSATNKPATGPYHSMDHQDSHDATTWSGGGPANYTDYRQTNATVHPNPAAHNYRESSVAPTDYRSSQQQSRAGTPLQHQQQQSQQLLNDPATYQHVIIPPTPSPQEKIEDRGPPQPNRSNTIRRNSRLVQGDPPSYNFQQAMSDHFDHYKRPPSRDGSVDRFSQRGGSRGLAGSRQPSVDKPYPPSSAQDTPPPSQPPLPSVAAIQAAMSGSRPPSVARSPTPQGNGSVVGAPPIPRQTTPFQDEVSYLRKRGPTQEVIPSVNQPKRTESLYVAPIKGAPVVPKNVPVTVNLQRKKSLPDVAGLPTVIGGDSMSREEVSVLSSARREEVRRMQDEAEKLRANPLLYLVSPHVKEWFSRQQLVMLVLFINISLAIMFYKLLT